MKKELRIIKIFMITYAILSMYTNVLANDHIKTELDVVQKEGIPVILENNQGYLSKKIVSSNSKDGEVNIEIELKNTKKETSKTTNTEIFLVIDNSPSMDTLDVNGKSRKKAVIEATKKLVNSIFNNDNSIKIGIVDFHGVTNGKAGINNANLRIAPNNNKASILAELNKLATKQTENGTNIDAGLQMAEKNFSSACDNKVIILLTDGIPNADAKGNISTTYDKAITVQNNTKNTLKNLEQSQITIISMMTGKLKKDDLEAVERIFGTQNNPTVGKYYLVETVDVEKIIEEEILKNVLESIKNSMNNIKIVDYFPKEIIDNFNFEYVSKPNMGNISSKIDEQTNSIEWNIQSLESEKSAKVQYKLKIKDMNNKDLLNKIISTNEKIDLTYKDKNNKEYVATLDNSPKIKLVAIEENVILSGETASCISNKEEKLSISDSSVNITYINFDNDNIINDTITKNYKNTNINTNTYINDVTIKKDIIPYAGKPKYVIIIFIILIVFTLIKFKQYKMIIKNYKDV